MKHWTGVILAAGVLALPLQPLSGQQQQQPQTVPNSPDRPAPSSNPQAVEKLGDGRFRINNIIIDTARREASMSGSINDVMVLEWVINTKGANKAYESAVTVDTDAVSFNTAMILIGFDKSRSRVPTLHFDPEPPKGDPVEIMIEWTRDGQKVRVPVEQIVYDKQSGKTMPSDGWVYTGSSFRFDGLYAADIDGILVGFVHSPTPIIEQVGKGAVNRFGSMIVHPNIGLPPGTPVTMTVRNLTPGRAR